MPLTPLHLGFGLLCRGVARDRFPLVPFVVAQVAIDLEPLAHGVLGHPSLHGLAHSLLGAVAVGCTAGTAVWAAGAARWAARRRAQEEGSVRPLLARQLLAGLVGGLSHTILDALMHADVPLIWPIAASNPLLLEHGAFWATVVCSASGVVGLLLISRE